MHFGDSIFQCTLVAPTNHLIIINNTLFKNSINYTFTKYLVTSNFVVLYFFYHKKLETAVMSLSIETEESMLLGQLTQFSDLASTSSQQSTPSNQTTSTDTPHTTSTGTPQVVEICVHTPTQDMSENSDVFEISANAEDYIVSPLEWYNCIQEKKANTNKTTFAKCFPILWKMVGKYALAWKKNKWEVPSKLKNATEFKNKVVQHVLTMRKAVDTDSIPFLIQKDLPAFSPLKTKCLFYDQSVFEKHALNHYKVDPFTAKEKLLPQPNDIIRLFGIAALQENRDSLERIGASKHSKRSDADGKRTYLRFLLLQSWSNKFFRHCNTCV